jgi:hypothetical protein
MPGLTTTTTTTAAAAAVVAAAAEEEAVAIVSIFCSLPFSPLERFFYIAIF